MSSTERARNATVLAWVDSAPGWRCTQAESIAFLERKETMGQHVKGLQHKQAWAAVLGSAMALVVSHA